MEQDIEQIEEDAYDAFQARSREAIQEVDAYFSAPQLTCGQFTEKDLRTPYDIDMLTMQAVKPQEFETFQFFSKFKSKFQKEINEYKEMKERLGDIGLQELRRQYLDSNKYPEDHLARFFNPYFKPAE